MIDNCPICKKDWCRYPLSRYCKICHLHYDFNSKQYILVNDFYSENEFEKMLKLKAFW